MKKFKLYLLLSLVFLVTGCGADISCTKKYNDSLKYEIKVTADISKSKVVNSTANFQFKTSEAAMAMCNLNKLIDIENVKVVCKEKQVSINGYEKFLIGNGKTSISKDEFIKLLKDDGFKC